MGSDADIQNSLALSETLQKVPVFTVDLIFVDPEIRDVPKEWVDALRNEIIPATVPVQEGTDAS